MRGGALTLSLIQRLLWAPLKPGQIWILPLCVQGASGLLGLALFSTGVFLAPLNLFGFLSISFCDRCFSCSSDGALLCLATRIESPIACRLCAYSIYDCGDSVAPRRLLLFDSGAWLVVFASRSAVRERVPWPNPRLAMFDTCRRMSSIEVVRLGSRGLGRPRTSHRIFGFRVARARFFLVLSARHPVDSFISAPYIWNQASPMWETALW